MLRWPVAIALGVLPVAVVVGIGLAMHRGSSALSQQDFVAQATAICQTRMAERDALAKPRTENQVVGYLNAGLRSLRGELAQLGALRAPAAAAAPLRAALGEEDQQIAQMQQVISRPDYIRLATTVPKDPASAPSWLRAWEARQRALGASLKANLNAAGLSGCLR